MSDAADVYFPHLGPDDLVRCPYDETHIVTVRRFPYHLMKERKNNPGTEMKQCPFNMLHHVPAKEFDYHKVHCPDKDCILASFAQKVIPAANVKRSLAPNSPPSSDIPSGEDWEAEADASAHRVIEPLISRRKMPSAKSPPLAGHRTMGQNQTTVHRPSTRIMRYTPDLYPDMQRTRLLALEMEQFRAAPSRVHLFPRLSLTTTTATPPAPDPFGFRKLRL